MANNWYPYCDGYIVKYSTANPPSVPILATPTNNAMNAPINPTLQWNASSYASTYRVQTSLMSSFATLLSHDVVTSTSKSLSALANNTLHYWRVKSINASDSSAWSAVWNFTTLPTIHSVPLTKAGI